MGTVSFPFMGSGDLFDEFRRIKESGEQLDDRIIEVCWNAQRGSWRMLRIRDDKPNANHKSIMQKILESIEDGVEIEAVRLLSVLPFKLFLTGIAVAKE